MKKGIKFTALCLAIILCFSAVSIQAFATNTNAETQVEKSYGPNAFIWPDEKTVRITKEVNNMNYTGSTTNTADDPYIILRFTEQSTGLSYTATFICDNKINRTGKRHLPAGTYTISEVQYRGNVFSLMVNFS